MPADRIAFALNARLPADIRIQGSSEVPPDFHPRFTATVKTYEYRILNRTFADPTRRLNSYFWYGPLDVDAMRQAASYLVGMHDFKSFATAKPEVTDTVRTIYETSLEKEDDLIRFRITGNGFLYNMVRIITGTLLEVGKGDYPPEKVKEILAAINARTNEIILAHCTIGIAQTEQFIIRNHFETESGIGIQGILPTGDVTIVKCGSESLDEYYLSTGTLVENTNYINMCRTQVRIKMNSPADYFLKTPLGNHHIMLYGNYEDILEEFLQANACKRIE